jgi:hypothetical protein
MNAVFTFSEYSANFVPKEHKANFEVIHPNDANPAGAQMTTQSGDPLTLQDGTTPITTQ